MGFLNPNTTATSNFIMSNIPRSHFLKTWGFLNPNTTPTSNNNYRLIKLE